MNIYTIFFIIIEHCGRFVNKFAAKSKKYLTARGRALILVEKIVWEETMLPQDPYMLLSFVNMKLRDRYESLADLCEDLDADEAQLRAALSAIGYTYSQERNQFI